MELGAFSVSLNVKDLEASKAFYEKLGFEQTGGDGSGYLIMVNGSVVIGLFHGMFEQNMLTFNPKDARAIQAGVKEAGYAVEREAEDGTGPAHFVMKDPDGNIILVDQHE